MTRNIAAILIASLFACDAPSASRDAQTVRQDADGATATVHDANAAAREDGIVLFLGTSLTAGYGVGASRAWPALIRQRIDSLGLPYRVVNAGLSGETSAGGLARLDWSLQDSVAVLVLELGANDGLRGLPVEQMHSNLDAILQRTRERYPDVQLVIAGMEAPPNLGAQYTQAFRSVFVELAAEHHAELIPFLLEGVAAEPSLNQADGIHPTEEGHEIIAEHVWQVLAPVLR